MGNDGVVDRGGGIVDEADGGATKEGILKEMKVQEIVEEDNGNNHKG